MSSKRRRANRPSKIVGGASAIHRAATVSFANAGASIAADAHISDLAKVRSQRENKKIEGETKNEKKSKKERNISFLFSH